MQQARALTVAALAAAFSLFGARLSPLAAQDQAGQLDDSTFVAKAASGGKLEVRLGELAQQKASNDAVRRFGRRMMTDHKEVNTRLDRVAKQSNVPVPLAMTSEQTAKADSLSKLSGENFDRAYMELMVKDHQEDVALFRNASQSLPDSALRSLASATLPTLEQHLALAEQTARDVGAPIAAGEAGANDTAAMRGMQRDTAGGQVDTSAMQRDTAAIQPDTAAVQPDTAAVQRDTTGYQQMPPDTSAQMPRDTSAMPETPRDTGVIQQAPSDTSAAEPYPSDTSAVHQAPSDTSTWKGQKADSTAGAAGRDSTVVPPQ